MRISKQMLREALLRLLEKKDLEKISVYELCQEAQINRTTFYRYYSNTYDVICEIRDAFFQTMEDTVFAEEYEGIRSLEETLILLRDNRRLVNILLRVFSEEAVFEELFRRRSFLEQIYRDACSGYDEEWKKSYAAVYSVKGSYAIIQKWLNDPDDIPPGRIALLIREINDRK